MEKGASWQVSQVSRQFGRARGLSKVRPHLWSGNYLRGTFWPQVDLSSGGLQCRVMGDRRSRGKS